MTTLSAAPHSSPAARRRGLLLATLGAIAFSGKAIIVKLAYRYGVDAVTLIMYRMLFALPLFLILSWWAGRGPLSAMLVATPVLWLSALNATACTFAPVIMVMMAIERIGPSLTAQTGTIGPLSTILMAVVLLGEPFTAWVAAGTVLVIAGIWLLARQPPGKPAR